MKKILVILFFTLALAIFSQENSEINIQEEKELGGVKQWIMMKGENTKNPVLLFLHGGPGFPETPFAYIDSKKLEKHFIVVNWDQRGCGKSFDEDIPLESITMRQILSDTKELVDYLKERFNKEKIFLVGHSWGSILGMYTIYNHPDDFYAYVGMGQVVNSEEGEMISYNYALNKAEEANDSVSISQLKEIGTPPYKGYDDLSVQRAILAKYGGAFKNISYRDIYKMIFASPDYTQAEKQNYMKAFVKINNILWPEVTKVNFFDSIKEVKVPVYFFVGKYDYGCPFELVEKYFAQLKAPQKELIWFNHSGHWMNLEEPGKYQDIFVNKVLRNATRH